jgi:hypothetical protein
VRSNSKLVVQPEVEELQLLKLQIEGPMKWSESYKLYGIRQGSYTLMADDQQVRTFEDNCYYATCLVCDNYRTPEFTDSSSAVHDHFMHCAGNHGYIFPVGYSKDKFKVADRQLQDLIQSCQVYNLPFYGYDDHTDCIMQYRQEEDGKHHVVCAVHKGNEPKPAKKWLGYY